MAKAAVPILTLDSLVDRPVVIIDGQEYQLITQAILPPIDAHRVTKFSRRIDELIRKGAESDLSEEEEKELEALPDKICRLILKAPTDVHQSLEDPQRMEIIATFLTAPWLMQAASQAPNPETPNPSIGENSSHVSSASTEGIH